MSGRDRLNSLGQRRFVLQFLRKFSRIAASEFQTLSRSQPFGWKRSGKLRRPTTPGRRAFSFEQLNEKIDNPRHDETPWKIFDHDWRRGFLFWNRDWALLGFDDSIAGSSSCESLNFRRAEGSTSGPRKFAGKKNVFAGAIGCG